MINPLENNGFKHELKFYDFNTDWYEIPEPIGFDGGKFVMKQDGGFARDVTYFAIDGLEFPDAYGMQLTTPRIVNPRGDTSDFMDYGLQWLLACRKEKGSLMRVGYRVSVNGVVFREFELDTRDEDLTDGKTWFKCKLIEINLVADHKRNEKNTFEAFSDKNWKDETITPIDSFNYLCKATPLNKESVFKLSEDFPFSFVGGSIAIMNPSQLIEKYEINDTLGWLLPFIDFPDADDIRSFGLIRAVVDTNNIDVEVDLDIEYDFSTVGGSAKAIDLIILVEGVVSDFLLRINPTIDGVTGRIITKVTYRLDQLEVGKKIVLYYRIAGFTFGILRKNTITIKAIETEIDLVIPAVRYSDLIKQSVKFVNGLPVEMPDFDINGKFYDQAVFNRSSLGNKKIMYATPDLVLSQLNEVCADAEFSQEKLDIRQRVGFYENKEIASFLVIPSEDYSEPFNEDYLINNYQFGYKNFEQDKTEAKTSLSVHTQSEWLPRNDNREDAKKIELSFVRDPRYRQTVFNLEIKSPSTSTDRDEQLFIEDMVRIPPNAFNEFSRTLLMRWSYGKLEILNRNTLGTNDDAILNWNAVGISVGGGFQILSTVNIGNYIVHSIKDDGSILTLTPVGTIPNFNGNATIKMKFYYSSAIWQTRTNEGFTIAPEGFANLTYTIKRNMFHWFDWLATCLLYAKKDMKNSFFKNFGELETQLETETTPVVENATVLYDDLPTPIVEPKLIKSTIVAPYLEVVDYLQKYKADKGYIRLYSSNGDVKLVYPKMFEYAINTAKADIVGELKYISEYLKIDVIGTDIYVNDAPYNLQGTADWFKTMNDEIQLYDKKSNPLSNWYNYNFVLLNGQQFSSMNSLVSALNAYTWT